MTEHWSNTNTTDSAGPATSVEQYWLQTVLDDRAESAPPPQEQEGDR
jgi:hypothetical protein